ncbi:MAG: CRISPR-associated endonuclease Cas3'' [Opitutales bacterium]|nr:CRISPR-associated endonuclease Cas3'' [Opitutales bacterium]
MHGHLNKVAYWAGEFAAEMFPPGSAEAAAAKSWGELAGWWHDLGKFSVEFQERLQGIREQANHSSAGAVHAYSSIDGIGQLFAFLIAGHHAGLADWIGPDRASLFRRLRDHELPQWKEYAPEILLNRQPPERITMLNPKDGPAIALFTRLLFSCLVDADFIATEAFMNFDQGARRPNWPDDILSRMEEALEAKNRSFGEPTTSVNRHRASVRADCLAAARRPPGLFTLTVPTGGGKTLSSLAFALRHAITHGLRRVIYVIPYTSIIEQNAGEFRNAFAELIACLPPELSESLVLEHHSNFESAEDDEHERPVCRLAAENWDAPLVVTTSVQFFESLFANKTSRSRKLHNIARSVVILDEAQNLPVNLLSPCLNALRNLQSVADCSIVFCTATQPAIGKRSGEKDPFNKISLDLPTEREIIKDVPRLFNALQRVSVPSTPESLSDEALVDRLRQYPRVLCILNSKPHAAKILELLGKQSEENLHLSAQLCPEHRRAVLRSIRSRELNNEPCRLIATTVVEAGVDIDFPVVFRALTGLDSFAQAAGRCNRHGKLSNTEGHALLGETVFFEPTDAKTPTFLKQAINATRQVLPDHSDLLGPEAIRRFFEIHYWLSGGNDGENWDKPEILACFNIDRSERQHPFGFSYRTAAEAFRLIEDFQTPVIIEPVPDLWPGQDSAKSVEICGLLEGIRESHRRHYPAPRNAHRRLQSYTVQIPKKIHERLCREGAIQIYHDQFPILTHPKNHYDPKLGLIVNAEHSDADAFIL